MNDLRPPEFFEATRLPEPEPQPDAEIWFDVPELVGDEFVGDCMSDMTGE